MRPIQTLLGCLMLICSTSALAELRAYEVDLKYRQEVYEALRNVLLAVPVPGGAGYRAVGTAELLPDGRILIDASSATHAQIDAVLEGISERQASPAPQVTLRYWVLLGSRESGQQEDAPQILRDVLDEIERVHGSQSFRVVGSAALVSESGRQSVLDSSGTQLSVAQRAYVEGSTLYADMEIEFSYVEEPPRPQGGGPQAGGPSVNPFQTRQRFNQDLDLETTIDAGEFVVLSESAIDSGDLSGTLFYIVHWPGLE